MANMKKNGFWIGMGVAGAAAVGVFAGLILPKWTDATTKKNQIKKETTSILGKLKDMPGDQNLRAWEDHKAKLQNDYEAHVQVLERRDKELEKWFEGFGPSSTLDQFLIAYGDQGNALDKRLRDAGVLVGLPRSVKDGDKETTAPDGDLGFNWCSKQSFSGALTPDEQMEAKSQLQKRYWLCEYVASALLAEGDAKPHRLIDVHFLHPSPIKGISRSKFVDIHAGTGSSGGSAGVEMYQGTPTRDQALADRFRMYLMDTPAGTATAASFLEYQLPMNGEEGAKPLGSTLTFGVAVEIDHSDVPKLLRSFIAPRGGPELPVQVIGVNVFVPDQNPMTMTPQQVEAMSPEERERLGVDKGFKIPKFTKDESQKAQEWEREFVAQAKNVQPARARLILLCQAIDFEPANRALAKKAPAAP